VDHWVCEERDEQGIQCAAYFCGKPDGQVHAHLRETHKYDNEERVLAAANAWTMMRLGVGAFWCGFCKKRIECESDRENANRSQMVRFNHIETEHFKKDQTIGSWVPAEKLASHLRGLLSDRIPNDDESVSSNESQGTRLSGDTLVQRGSGSQSLSQSGPKIVDPRQLAKSPRLFQCVCG
jgi:hypothetical protein